MRFFCALLCLNKMDKEKINQALKRTILDGSKFDSLIDQPADQSEDLGKGNTFHTVAQMRKWTLQHYKQVNRLAEKLQQSTLQETCLNIYNFLFNYIQYDIDNILQNLRSPANSWFVARQTGIDCKSYSIFASSILLNLKIKHYIRQIKQPKYNPDNFTHVYIVVPIDQVTGSLSGGYYTIDGTKKDNSECKFTTNKEIFMALPHLGLNGAKARTKRKRIFKKTTATKKTVSKKSFFNCFNK